MLIVQKLCAFALQQLIEGACKVVGVVTAQETVVRVTAVLERQFTDHSQTLEKALRRATERSWRALEIALAGSSFWSCCKTFFAPADQKAFAEQVRGFLDLHQLPELATHGADLRKACLHDLQAARKAGLLDGGHLSTKSLAQRVGSFAQFTNSQQRAQAEFHLLGEIVKELEAKGRQHLAWLLNAQVHQGTSLLVAAVRYFFRREIETDAALWRGLAWDTWANLADAQQKAFASLQTAMNEHGQRMEQMLSETHGVVIDILEEVKGQKEQIGQLYQAVLQLLDRHQMATRELRPQDGLSIRSQKDRAEAQSLMRSYRALPKDQQVRLPALLNGIGKLQHAGGDFAAAQAAFAGVAAASQGAPARAEAYHNAYLAAVEMQDWPYAIAALKWAMHLAPQRFQPFDQAKYEAERILGAGGFGVSFLGQHRISRGYRVIKSLRVDSLAQDKVSELMAEAAHMERVSHEAVIKLYDCDYADTAKTRLYLAMEYFDGLTLGEHVKRHGCVEPKDAKELFTQVGAGLEAAHGQDILHRDIKPDNILVKRDGGGGWRVKIIDFGLALRDNLKHGGAVTPQPEANGASRSDIAGTIDYAAPEQLGRLPGVPPGRYSDVYGFARTFCYALFGTPHPLGRHWKSVTKGLSNWLDRCLEDSPKDRFPDFPSALEALGKLTIPKKPKKHEPQVAPAIVVLRGLKVGEVHPLPEGVSTLGRDAADIDLEEQEPPDRSCISREHCAILIDQGKLFLEDRNSSNGTYLNRKRLTPGQKYPLTADDHIQLGVVVLKVKM